MYYGGEQGKSMQHKKPLILLIALIGVIGLLSISSNFKTSSRSSAEKLLVDSPVPTAYFTVEQSPDHGKVHVRIGEQLLYVEVVKTSASISQGLSGRSEIGADGMIFVFQQSMMPRFWMKEMKIPLDMIWINDGKIVDITENTPIPDPETPLDELPTFAPKEPVIWVLEVPAGTAKKHNWKIGTSVTEMATILSS